MSDKEEGILTLASHFDNLVMAPYLSRPRAPSRVCTKKGDPKAALFMKRGRCVQSVPNR